MQSTYKAAVLYSSEVECIHDCRKPCNYVMGSYSCYFDSRSLIMISVGMGLLFLTMTIAVGIICYCSFKKKKTT